MPCCGSGVEDTVAMQSNGEDAVPKSTPVVAQNAESAKAPASDSAKTPAPVQETAPAPAPPAPAPTPAVPAPAQPAVIEPTSNVREEPKPAWAAKEKAGTVAGDAPAPSTSSDGQKASGARPAKNVPAGFVSGTRKDQGVSSGVQDRIAGLKASGLKTNNTGGKRMKTPRIITDTKESWDKEGNITREITRYITEPDGSKRTEKETVYIPADQVEQVQQ